MYFSFGFNICLCQLCQALKYGIFTRTPFAFRGVFLGGRCRKNLTDHLISATSPPPRQKIFGHCTILGVKKIFPEPLIAHFFFIIPFLLFVSFKMVIYLYRYLYRGLH
jgi:hypothetical protein